MYTGVHMKTSRSINIYSLSDHTSDCNGITVIVWNPILMHPQIVWFAAFSQSQNSLQTIIVWTVSCLPLNYLHTVKIVKQLSIYPPCGMGVAHQYMQLMTAFVILSHTSVVSPVKCHSMQSKNERPWQFRFVFNISTEDNQYIILLLWCIIFHETIGA